VSGESRGVQLFFVRHADAGNPDTWKGADAARPLSEKGRRQAERLGALLKSLGIEVDAVISSPKVRAADTARIVGDAIGTTVEIDARLAGGFGLTELRSLLGERGSKARVVLVGHDPDFSDLVASLVGAAIPLRKGALARIELAREPIAGSGTLRWLIPPDAVAS
jgi:phosphohistidine phosphatase